MLSIRSSNCANRRDITCSLVTTDQLYDEYNYGERTPLAMRKFPQDAQRDGSEAAIRAPGRRRFL